VGAVLGREAAERAASRIGRRLGLSANVSIRTVGTEAELPADIRQQAAKDGATGTVIAVHRGDEIFLVADQHKSLAQVEESILHESNHYGANALFGKAKRQAYTRLYFKLGRADGIRDLAAKQGVNMDAYFTTADELRKDGKISDAQRFSYLVDEFLAHVQGKKAYASLPQKIKTAIQEFYGAIRNWMNQRGFVNLAQFNDADLAYLLRSIHRAAQGNTQPGKRQAMFMVAWHGGPTATTIDVDGVQRPTENSSGRLIHPTEEGVRNFWRWMNGGMERGRVDQAGRRSQEYGRGAGADGGDSTGRRSFFSANGRPHVYFHGTGDNVRAFEVG
jgi:hypothetical protein